MNRQDYADHIDRWIQQHTEHRANQQAFIAATFGLSRLSTAPADLPVVDLDGV